jgi:hypothetical protein
MTVASRCLSLPVKPESLILRRTDGPDTAGTPTYGHTGTPMARRLGPRHSALTVPRCVVSTAVNAGCGDRRKKK